MLVAPPQACEHTIEDEPRSRRSSPFLAHEARWDRPCAVRTHDRSRPSVSRVT